MHELHENKTVGKPQKGTKITKEKPSAPFAPFRGIVKLPVVAACRQTAAD
jgi:hypothetical protein